MCKYCEKDKVITPFYENKIGDETSITAAIVPDSQQLAFDYIKGNIGYTDAIDIKYCPFCGRDLEK